MNDLQEKTIAALEKQVELLSKDGVSQANQDSAIEAILALTGLLREIKYGAINPNS